MRVISLSFRRDPAHFAALYMREHGLEPLRTLVVTPTERFKIYMAQSFLKISRTNDAIAPRMFRANELADALTSMAGLARANRMQRLSLLYRACRETEGFSKLFGEEVFSSFSSFQRLALSLLGSFEELNRMEIDPRNVKLKEFYRNFSEHYRIIQELFERYEELQRKSDLYDASFLLKKVKKIDIEAFFSCYSDVLLISPLLLTTFEKRVFSAIEDKLHVILQDTEDCDFSRLLSFHPTEDDMRRAGPEEIESLIEAHEASTRIEAVMLLLSVLRMEIARGIQPHEIAVVNIDPVVCEAVKRSCDALGIPSNYTRGISVSKAPIFTFLRLVGAFFDSGLDSDILLELVRHEFFCELGGLTEPTGRRESEELKQRIVDNRIFRLSSIKSGHLDKEYRDTLDFLYALYSTRDFSELYTSLLALFERLGGKRPFEFYTVRDMLLETAIELSELKIEAVKFGFSAIESRGHDSSKSGLIESRLHNKKLQAIEPERLNSHDLEEINSRESPFSIFLKYAGGKRYTVKGSMRQGVQILGLLETRGVRFKTSIIPTFNEGYFPTSPRPDPVFSSELRSALGLSTQAEREKLEYYYLKRLIDASERSFLISIRDTAGDFEIPSRYYHIINARSGKPLPYTLPVQKKEHVAPREREIHPLLAVKPDSYSRIDIHRLKRCEVQYYIARILKIEGERILTRSIETDMVGSIVHDLLRDLYRDFDFKNFPSLPDFHRRIQELFFEHFTDGLFGTREEVLTRRILLENLKEALGRDYERFRKGSVVCSEWLEKNFTARLGSYILSGRIDRIDRSKEGEYLILDYKTGRLPALRAHKSEGEYMEVQLGFYGLLFRESFPDLPIRGLGYFDLLRRRDMDIVVADAGVEQYLDGFEMHLLGFLDEFGNKDRLSLANDIVECTYCPYYNICRIYET